MAHIPLQQGLPGMRALQTYRPETAAPMNQLANILLRGPSALSPGERELIGATVSARNNCRFCESIHGAVAARHLGSEELVAKAKVDPEYPGLPDKLRALLAIAARVQEGGKHVTADAIDRARSAGASDLEIHDTVLIAAAFCMFNRYVDGLATWAPEDPDYYRERAALIIANGYSAGPPSNES